MKNNTDARVTELKKTIRENHISTADAVAALDFHLARLRDSGCFVEDSVCETLRKLIAQLQAKDELFDLTLDSRYL